MIINQKPKYFYTKPDNLNTINMENLFIEDENRKIVYPPSIYVSKKFYQKESDEEILESILENLK